MAAMHEWVQARFGALFAGARGRLKAFEATLIQARIDGIIRVETDESTFYNNSAADLTDALKVVRTGRAIVATAARP